MSSLLNFFDPPRFDDRDDRDDHDDRDSDFCVTVTGPGTAFDVVLVVGIDTGGGTADEVLSASSSNPVNVSDPLRAVAPGSVTYGMGGVPLCIAPILGSTPGSPISAYWCVSDPFTPI